jgi:hypothetical protein
MGVLNYRNFCFWGVEAHQAQKFEITYTPKWTHDIVRVLSTMIIILFSLFTLLINLIVYIRREKVGVVTKGKIALVFN